MPKLPVLSGYLIVRILESKGYRFDRQKGSHMIMVKDGLRSIPVPNHDPVSTGTLVQILKQAGISRKEL
jgi:predicted RNA binding protein YcfA (HicA-like mRNA interferase family)